MWILCVQGFPRMSTLPCLNENKSNRTQKRKTHLHFVVCVVIWLYCHEKLVTIHSANKEKKLNYYPFNMFFIWLQSMSAYTGDTYGNMCCISLIFGLICFYFSTKIFYKSPASDSLTVFCTRKHICFTGSLPVLTMKLQFWYYPECMHWLQSI